ncbi:MAG: hypothetical protein ACRDZ4_17240 [Egibacteraceae bacterium]
MTTNDLTRGPIPLRPMNLGDLLDGAVRLFVANWRPLLLTVGVVVVPLQLLSAFLQRDQPRLGLFQLFTDPTALERLAQQGSLASPGQQTASLAGLVLLLFLPVLVGAVCLVVGRSYLGQPVDWRAALRTAGGRFGSLLGATILVSLLVASLFLPAFALFVAAIVAQSGGLVALGFLLLLGGIVGVVIVSSLYVAVAPAVVTEGIGPVAAMRRSWRLRRPRLWPTVGVVLVTWLFTGVISLIVGVVTSGIAAGLGGPFAWVLTGIGGLLGQLVGIPLGAIVATLLYFDGRIRQEGLDLQMMAADLDR